MSASSGRGAQLLKDLIRNHEGPLTRELVRKPGRFGRGQVPKGQVPDAVATVVCGFCSTGCGLKAHLRDGEAVGLSPETTYPVNRGMACPKGWEALSPLEADDRATKPLLRDADGALNPVSWDTAMRTFVERMKRVQARSGPASAAFLGTGQMPTEELAYLGSLAKFGMGMIHGDGNTRQCMATAVEAYKQSFGFDAPPYTYADFEESDVIVLVGSNLCIAHPILWERICRNPRDPDVIVIDPRRTETAVAATMHIPLRPKSDLTLFYGLARILIEHGAVDADFVRDHVDGYTEFAAFVQDFTPERVFEESGIPESTLETLAEKIETGGRVSFWWTMGVNQSHEGVRVAQAIINLALITGQIGQPGTGANSITGQCNAMGSRLFSNTTGLLGGRDFRSAQDRTDVSRILGVPLEQIPSERSLAYDEIIEGIRGGQIRALWVVATNTAHSWINQSDFKRVRDKLDFLVVQDMYASTETAQIADLVLPAAGWGEKDGTFINSERRIGRVRKIRRAPGQSLSDFQIFRLIAHYWGCESLFERWKTPEDVFDSMRALSAGQPCDFSGVEGYAALDRAGGIQWPLPPNEDLGDSGTERRLFADGNFFHPNGRARLCFDPPRAPEETTNKAYPFILMTGRGSSAQWHTETRTGKSAVLRSLAPQETFVEINPRDASSAGLADGRLVTVRSRRGHMQARTRITGVVPSGSLFIAMHDAATNQLTYPAFDPFSHQPSYKHCAVAIEATPDPDDAPTIK
ncbi:MAG: molybdopterin oxidoreductase family protein [Myxococcota bacterium]